MQRLSLVLTCALLGACVHEAPVTPAPAPAAVPAPEAAATAPPAGVAATPDATAAPPAAQTAPTTAPAPTPPPPPAAAPEVRTPTTPPAKSAQAAPGKTATSPAAAAKAAPAAAAAAATAPAAAAAPPPAAALDLPRLEQRLRDTRAIGVFTKLSLKNQVDDLLSKFRAYHKGNTPPTLPQLRQSYEVLLIKVISVLQDDDPKLAADVGSSREAIWSVLSDPKKFASLDA